MAAECRCLSVKRYLKTVVLFECIGLLNSTRLFFYILFTGGGGLLTPKLNTLLVTASSLSITDAPLVRHRFSAATSGLRVIG